MFTSLSCSVSTDIESGINNKELWGCRFGLGGKVKEGIGLDMVFGLLGFFKT